METTGRRNSEKGSREVKNTESLAKEWTPRGRLGWGPQKATESFLKKK